MGSVRTFGLILAAVLALAPALVRAQETAPPALIADQVRYDPAARVLTATGNVEVYFQDRILRASAISYDQASGQITATGPITVTDDATNATLLADTATLDPELRAGLLQGARLVLEQNLQFAAIEARRVNNRFTTFEKTVASACQVCTGKVPLWLIRADRVIQDNEAKQIHFEGARFELFGAPIAYFPYLRVPDPSVKRASGFLVPQFRNSDIFGFGFRIPYFLVLDDHRDLTVTPFWTTKGAKLLEAEYRQRFANGRLDVNGAVAADDNPALPSLRAFLRGNAQFRLRGDFDVSASINWASDNAILNEYGYSNADRLTSSVVLSKQTNASYFRLGAAGFQSLRDGVNDRTLPIVVPDFSYRRHWPAPVVGGRVQAEVSTVGLTRLVGRDVYRLNADLAWRKPFSFGPGIVGLAHAGVTESVYLTRDDPAFATDPVAIIKPVVGVELRWPLVRQSGTATDVIEPVAQLVFSDAIGDLANVPNEDSQQVEFDAANLFSLNRYPGTDVVETGLRANLGMTYRRFDPSGWNFGLAVGQVFRLDKTTGFPAATGLNSHNSSIVAAANIDFPPHFRLSNQTLLSSKFQLRRNDLQVDLDLDRWDMNASYVFVASDVAQPERHELSVATRYQALPNWAIDLELRRDLNAADNVFGQAGIEFGNECIRSRFSVSRRFTNSNSLPASTEFGFSVALAGLGGSTETWPASGCSSL